MTSDRPSGFYYVSYAPGDEDELGSVTLQHSVAYYDAGYSQWFRMSGDRIGYHEGLYEDEIRFTNDPVPVPPRGVVRAEKEG